MVLKERREKQKQERYEEILDAAEKVFFPKGYEQSTMDDIAQVAQLSRALLYVYFKDKSAIMRGIMLRAGNCLQARFEQVLQQENSGFDQVLAMGHAYHEFSNAEPDYFDVLISVTTFPGPDVIDDQQLAMNRCWERINNTMVRALQNGIDDGSIDQYKVPDLLQTAFYLQGALHGVIMQARIHGSGSANSQRANQLILYTINMLSASIKGR